MWRSGCGTTGTSTAGFSPVVQTIAVDVVDLQDESLPCQTSPMRIRRRRAGLQGISARRNMEVLVRDSRFEASQHFAETCGRRDRARQCACPVKCAVEMPWASALRLRRHGLPLSFRPRT